ncbi:glycoside hydrolase family 26 protein [Gonapodya prolifera JEL478]|uniref:Glycoside hydrolase family 26 protein n=1 Tax=Gonapodya prolifera (strain JEL478) TaxID=1344416 RepID=A0A139AT30_GONPJ|nr:glycoside hydrolase family 26 protein [Gonapodya prolifera JEL478]|eukprot:KXS19713.1 glycoside hydrolase family 26 protein [Gonapodya prolifera JEL478]
MPARSHPRVRAHAAFALLVVVASLLLPYLGAVAFPQPTQPASTTARVTGRTVSTGSRSATVSASAGARSQAPSTVSPAPTQPAQLTTQTPTPTTPFTTSTVQQSTTTTWATPTVCDTIYAKYQAAFDRNVSLTDPQDYLDWEQNLCSLQHPGGIFFVRPSEDAVKPHWLGPVELLGGIPVPYGKLLYGTYLDQMDNPTAYNQRTGLNALLFGDFYEFPLTDGWYQWNYQKLQNWMSHGSIMIVTLEPKGGLDKITDAAIAELIVELIKLNAKGISVIVRFAHEMNGSWYSWSQQPRLYRQAFRRVANAVHAHVPAAAMLWAPNIAAGYPFGSGPPVNSTNFKEMDTNGDGVIDGKDDPYHPYYPGDEYVDWVETQNNLPPPNQLEGLFTGTSFGGPNFMKRYAMDKQKPFIHAETGAFWNPTSGPTPTMLEMKRAWWRQVYSNELLNKYPIKAAMWFDIDKREGTQYPTFEGEDMFNIPLFHEISTSFQSLGDVITGDVESAIGGAAANGDMEEATLLGKGMGRATGSALLLGEAFGGVPIFHELAVSGDSLGTMIGGDDDELARRHWKDG